MLPKFPVKVLSALLLVFIIASCKKDEVPPAPTPSETSSYTSKMGGVRKWHGSNYYHASGPNVGTVDNFYYYPDTSFAITVVDDTTIQYWGTKYTHSRTDTANQIYYFGDAYYFYAYGMGKGIAYFYAKDSIVYGSGDKHGTTDQWVSQVMRWTYK